ncbi:MAG: RNA polymerase sigma factor SigJ [Actinomycetota bacterium]|nr:RNA polymerase sigma factor SigJ [Actinomycetota bacterium]
MTGAGPDADGIGDAVFTAERARLVGIAYRMLGDAAEAEDVVQDTWLKWTDVDHGSLDQPAAYLTTIVTRLTIDRLRSARVRRETYVGPWLAEPVLTDPEPAETVALAESVTIGFLHLLDHLGAVERAVYLLHEVFDLPYRDIGPMVDRSEDACRQIASRARRRLAEHREPARRRPEPGREQELVEGLLGAVVGGDMAALERLLTADVVLTSDGGGVRHAAVRPVIGASRVARFLTNLAKRAPENARLEPAMVNREPAYLVWAGDELELVLIVGASETGVDHLHGIRNPEKLKAITAGYHIPL